MPSDAGRRVAVLTAIVAVTGSACTGDGGPDRRPSAPSGRSALEGRLLLEEGTRGADVTVLTLPDGEFVEIRGEEFEEVDFFGGAVWGEDGTGYVIGSFQVEGDDGFRVQARSQLFAVSPDGEATPLGPPDLSFAYPVAALDHVLVATSCAGRPRTWALDLSTSEAWRLVAEGGCPAAVSPDGEWIAYPVSSPAGEPVWRARIDGSTEPGILLDLADLPGLEEVGIPRPRIYQMAWGGPGLAVGVADSFRHPEQAALVIGAPSGAPRIIPLGSAVPGEMAWEPEGSLLAFADCVDCVGNPGFGQGNFHGEIRLYDTRSGQLTQIAVSAEGFSGLVWSPNGETLATRWRAGELLFVDSLGREVAREEAVVLPLDWGP